MTRPGALLQSKDNQIAVLEDRIAVHMCRVRKALRRHGIEVKTHWGVGWSMSAADRAKLEMLISQGD